MQIEPEVRSQIEEITRRAGHLWRYLDVAGKQKRIGELEEKMSEPSFWDDQKAAQKVIGESNQCKAAIEDITKFKPLVDDLNAMVELVEEADEEEGAEYMAEIEKSTKALYSQIDDLEIGSFLTGPMDGNSAILSVQAGAGGTESCDWADMLYRMYSRWAENRGWKVEVLDLQQGEEAGISSVSLRFEGVNAYGYTKAERGVHRLVRISPFDSNSRRHTSFCAVDVVAEVDDDIDLDIPPDELRIDTQRASGAGGQHVNKTESAIRITHLPTNIVVYCQSQRSQHKNKDQAMRQLKSKLYELKLDEKRQEMEKFYGEKGQIGWGNQIRSYVFQPYQMVKDLRTGVETGNVQAVMDGDLDPFVNGWLRAGCPRHRNKEVQLED
ncbi:peptide chain release factor 2 [Cerasicoccus fimbriatus]|uniref:peptide chain release factor 2 n=1 Tax=Cerasicoccus fimbriatus TaxID=3014554 RepID=UPI0022B2E23E|nr:peptide chain release factor 2 [Cerasicoccus sp. TK19100]